MLKKVYIISVIIMLAVGIIFPIYRGMEIEPNNGITMADNILFVFFVVWVLLFPIPFGTLFFILNIISYIKFKKRYFILLNIILFLWIVYSFYRNTTMVWM